MPAAQWYTVHVDSPPAGTVGDTLASITSGGLHVDSAYDPDGDGTALVYADSRSDAIRAALTGGVVVNLSAVNQPTATYTFNTTTSTTDTTTHNAFDVTPTVPPTTTGPSTWKVWLEDLTANPGASDWDYNDFYWTVTVGIDPVANIPMIGVTADSPWVSATSGQPTATTFTLTRTGDLTQSLSVSYSARLTGTDGDLDSGVASFAANQSQAFVTVTIPATADTTERELVLWVVPSSSAQPTYLADGVGFGRVTVYSASASATVGVQSASDVVVSDPNAATAAAFTFDQGGAAPSAALTFRYQVTVYEGADLGTVVDGGIRTATFALGQTSTTVSVAMPAGTDPLTTSRRIAIRVLPPLAPGGYAPIPGRDTADLFLVKAPNPAEPKEEPDSPESERLTGGFRKGLLTLLAKQNTELPFGWEAHHQYIRQLRAQWEKKGVGVKWDDPNTALGVPSNVNQEFDTLYEKWLAKYSIGDPKKMTVANFNLFRVKFEKFNASIRKQYEPLIILPNSTAEEVNAKNQAWQNIVAPGGKIVLGSLKKWEDGQPGRFIDFWKEYEK